MTVHNVFEHYFPIPKFLEMQTVGIDITPLSVRMIEILEYPHLKVGIYDEARLTNPVVVADGDNKELINILCNWKKKYKLHYVKASLPEDKAYLFDTEIELGTEESMRNAIEFSIEENVPLKGNEVIFDFRIIGQSNKDGFTKVAVTVLPLEVVNAYHNLFEECGLTPVSFLIEAQGLSRALIRREDMGTYLIVNIHSSRSTVFIISNGAVQFTSTLQTGSLDFTSTIQSKLGVGQEEADKLREEKGFTRTDDNKLLEALLITGSVFKEEIEKVYIYWNKHHVSKDPKDNVQKIILTGKDSLMPGFREYLNHSLKVPTEIGNVWANMSSFENYVPPLPLATALNFGTAIGLALPENE